MRALLFEFYLSLESPPEPLCIRNLLRNHYSKSFKNVAFSILEAFFECLKSNFFLAEKLSFMSLRFCFAPLEQNFWLWCIQLPWFSHFFISFSPLCGGTDTVKGSKMRMSSNNNVFPVTFDNRNWKWSKVITQTFIKSRFLYTMEERLREFKILGKICVSGIRKWRKVGDSSSLYSIIIFNGGK